MSRKMPPIPPANRTDKGPAGPDDATLSPEKLQEQAPRDSDQRGQEANIRQNTTHQGYQQDR
ncbi:hypothetical protein EDC65_4684 [Stella humosa]|uniref:Uncharacterized protein n=1 Tax=Stella humosa TaxID=94 RepID=A0A3N1KN47_9PROT|nr:hypothetical protein [Stella humosa]ROP83153.1 hypothetical protein EDC65_4684 [Stella humosa]BBK30070.1 hypothetical protein STHU_07040 [Stella humosa]